MNLILVGASGFIGGYLQKKLDGKVDFVNVDIKNPPLFAERFRKGDVRDVTSLRTALTPADCLVLLAAEHQDNVTPATLYYDVNVEGARNITQVAVEKGIQKIIFTSSVAVYGLNKPCPTEESDVDPFNHYGISKYQAEEVLTDWYNEDKENRQLIIIRPTVVFGPGNRGNVYNLLSQISSGKFLMIGKGENVKSMAYVENVAAFIAYCIQNDQRGKQIFNYVDKPDFTTQQLLAISESVLNKKIFPLRIPYSIGLMGGTLLDAVSFIIGKKFPVSAVRVRKFCATTQYSAGKVENSGFRPPLKLEDGLRETIKSIIALQQQAK